MADPESFVLEHVSMGEAPGLSNLEVFWMRLDRLLDELVRTITEDEVQATNARLKSIEDIRRGEVFLGRLPKALGHRHRLVMVLRDRFNDMARAHNQAWGGSGPGLGGVMPADANTHKRRFQEMAKLLAIYECLRQMVEVDTACTYDISPMQHVELMIDRRANLVAIAVSGRRIFEPASFPPDPTVMVMHLK